MRLIDADVFIANVVKYSHQSTKTIGKALADTPTVQAIPLDVALDIVHKTIYTFFDVADDDSEEPISAKDELLLKVNKSISAKLKEGDTE